MGERRRVSSSPFCSTRPPPPRIWDMELLFDARIVPLLSSHIDAQASFLNSCCIDPDDSETSERKFETGAITKRLLCPRLANKGSIQRSKASVLMQRLSYLSGSGWENNISCFWYGIQERLITQPIFSLQAWISRRQPYPIRYIGTEYSHHLKSVLENH